MIPRFDGRATAARTRQAGRAIGARAAAARGWGAALLCAAAVAAPAVRAEEVPPLTGRVVDRARILGSVRDRLTAMLAEHERRTTNQIAILTVPTLGGEAIEQFAERVGNAWRLGRKGRDNGVLVVVVPDDRMVRIAVGTGLEETLPDAAAKRIIEEAMVPAFRRGDFAAGVEGGVRAIIGELDRRVPREDGRDEAERPAPTRR